MRSAKLLRRLGLEILGWTLVVVGIAALVLPGPGLLSIFAGMVVLSQQYEWAERRLEPVKVAAFRSAADSVQTWPRVIASRFGALTIGAMGALWLVSPDAPGWWPVRESWWLAGGSVAGVTMIGSSIFAFAVIIYSFRTFRGISDPEGAAERIALEDD